MIKTMRTILTFHGWGFSPDIWNIWEQLMPGNTTFEHADRGYFGTPYTPIFPSDSLNNSQKILLVHSFGLHWCPSSLLEEADALVVLSGFLSFHPPFGAESKGSKLALQQMMTRFVEKPDEVLTAFYERVYHPQQPATRLQHPFDHDRLLADLEVLNSSSVTPERLAGLESVTIIHGDCDRIVSKQRARDFYSILLPGARYFEVKGGGHAIGFTRTDECIRFLNPIWIGNPGEEHAN